MLYNTAIKCLLGVGATICTDLRLAELRYPTPYAMLDHRWSISCAASAHTPDRGDPLNLALQMCRLANTKAYRTLIKSRDSALNAVTESRSALRQIIVEKSTSCSKRAQYMIINPDGYHHIISYIIFQSFRLHCLLTALDGSPLCCVDVHLAYASTR